MAEGVAELAVDRSGDLSSTVEAERYELSAPPAYRFAVDRRDFFRVLGAGLLVMCAARESLAQQESGGGRRGGGLPRDIGSWLHIGEDGTVSVFTGKTEVGQDIRTSLTQAVAEELRVPPAAIRLVMADTDRVPFDPGTFGSRSTPVMNLQLRRVAAAARNTLAALAAANWQVDRARVLAAAGSFKEADNGRSVTFAELVKGRQLTEVIPAEEALAPAAEWTVQGRPAGKVNGAEFVTGRHRYPADHRLPGMLFGRVVRPAAFGATLVSADTAAAEKMPGVLVVRDGNFLGLAAPSPEAAAAAAKSIRAEWRAEPQPSSAELFDYLKKHAAQAGDGDRSSRTDLGSLDEGLASADYRLEQTYTVAYIAHAPLEPRAALAEWSGEKLTVWTGTQRPFGARSELAAALRIPEDRVRVIVPDTGSAYGGKHTNEAAVEAARLARAANQPVKVVWTREEEFTWAYFRPAGVIEIRSGVKKDGTVTAWEFHNYNSGSAAIRPRYSFPNQRIEFHPSKTPLRQGSYRALAATANHFARESHMDELARLAGMDRLEFRRKNLKDERLRAVLEAAAKQFGWPAGRAPVAPGEKRGVGIAGGFEKGGYVANCAEVSVSREGAVNVVRAVTAFECGAIVNPDHLRSQVEGSVIMGIGGALFEAVEFENGRVLNAAFSRYRVPRFSDVPALETVLLDRKDLPSAGAGEAPIVAIAPAIGNAIFNATGRRLRSLPLAARGLTQP